MRKPNRELPKIMQEGFNAHQEGKDSTVNPYRLRSDEWHSWRRGFSDAAFGKMMNERYGFDKSNPAA